MSRRPTKTDYSAVFVLACIFIPLERLFPPHPGQRTLRRDWANDLLCVLINGFFIRSVFTVVAGLAMWAFTVLAGPGPFSMTARLPLWVQVIAVIIVADIGHCIAHRLLHSVPFLWRLHVIHHSIQEMDWLASHHVHPLKMVFSNTVSLLPLGLLGFSFEALVLHQAIYQAHTLLLHTTFRLIFGPLKWVFATPEHHHWHHANERDHNFAAQLSIIDTVGGTLFMPRNRKPVGYGLKEAVPHLYHQQML